MFKPENRWLSDTPAYKIRITVNGDRGTLSFECHYIDLKTGKAWSITRADQEVARIDGRVADHEHGRRNGSSQALSSCRKLRQRSSESRPPGTRHPLSWGDNAVARAVGRLPATVHVKLLIAFVGTAVLVMAIGLLGLRVLGQSNDRAERLGALQKRSFSYGKLQSDAYQVRLLLAENVDDGVLHGLARRVAGRRGASAVALDGAVLNALARIRPATASRQARIRAACRGRADPAPDPPEERAASRC